MIILACCSGLPRIGALLLLLADPATAPAAPPNADKADKADKADNVDKVVTPATGDTPDAEAMARAQRHFKLGVRLYEERDFPGALAEFRRAHQTVPSFKVLFNLGQVAQELHDWALALRYFQDYLDSGGSQVPEARRNEVQQRVQELTGRIAHLKLVIEAGPAEVSLDEVALAPDLILDQPLPVNPGRRRLSVRFPGQPPQLRVVEVASGDALEVRFAPAAPPAPVLAPPVVELKATPPGPLGLRPAAWWSWTATGVVGAAALTSGLLARNESQILVRERGMFPADPAALAWRQRRVQRYARSTDALLVGGVALGLVSLYLSPWRF